MSNLTLAGPLLPHLGDLDAVEGATVAVEEDAEAVLEKSAGLTLGEVLAPLGAENGDG